MSQESPLFEEWLSAQRHSLELTETLHMPAGAERTELLSLNEVCVLSLGHPLAVKKVLTPDDFHGENYVSLPCTDSYRQLLNQSLIESQVRRYVIVGTHNATSVCVMTRTGVGVSVVNPLVALDYAASGLVVRRFSTAVPFTVNLIRPLHRPPSALVQALSEHLQAGLPKPVASLDAILSPAMTA